MKQLKRLIGRLFELIGKEEMRVLPGHIAFFLVLSLVPIITLVGIIASFFHVSIAEFVSAMTNTLPKEISSMILPFIVGKGVDMNVIFFMIIGFLLASNGCHAIIDATDTLYKIDHEDYISTRIKAVFLTILLVGLFLFTLVILAFGNTILQTIQNFGVLGDLGDTIYQIFILLKWPVAFILVYLIIKLIYTLAPDKNIKSRYMTRGAVFTSLGWILVTAIYSYYVNHFANYDIFYGGLSNLIIMMMWIYIIAYIFVIGIAINVETYERVVKISNHKTEIDEHSN